MVPAVMGEGSSFQLESLAQKGLGDSHVQVNLHLPCPYNRNVPHENLVNSYFSMKAMHETHISDLLCDLNVIQLSVYNLIIYVYLGQHTKHLETLVACVILDFLPLSVSTLCI